jgi:hypothetical protein
MAVDNAYSPPDYSWLQRESEASVENPPNFPDNNSQQTKSGHIFEMDDTFGRERIRIHHRTGTFVEMHSNGDETHKIEGDGYEIIAGNKYVHITGFCNITIEGDAIVNVKGNKTELIEGNLNQVVKGDYTQVVKGESRILADGDMTVGCGSDFLGSLRLVTGDHMRLEGDLSVNGGISATNITSENWVAAGVGVNAGPSGFVSLLGGLAVGFPIAIPGSVTAAVQVKAPLGSFGTMSAVLMTDMINTKIFDTHIHMAKGPTSPPISGPMI